MSRNFKEVDAQAQQQFEAFQIENRHHVMALIPSLIHDQFFMLWGVFFRQAFVKGYVQAMKNMKEDVEAHKAAEKNVQ